MLKEKSILESVMNGENVTINDRLNAWRKVLAILDNTYWDMHIVANVPFDVNFDLNSVPDIDEAFKIQTKILEALTIARKHLEKLNQEVKDNGTKTAA